MNTSESNLSAESPDLVPENIQEDASEQNTTQAEELQEFDYTTLDLEGLVDKLQHLIENYEIQKISKHVRAIKEAFDFELRKEQKIALDQFVADGNNEIDFKFESPQQNAFEKLHKKFRDEKRKFNRQFEKQLEENLIAKKEIISQIKDLIATDENLNSTFKAFKELQEQWKSTGPVPKLVNDDLWKTYHHHVERFYDFVYLNKELRDRDFKHNYQEKLKIVEKAEQLSEEKDFRRAYAELQVLHKIWKEDLGPVAKEQREEIWERFSAATKVMHNKKQEFQKVLDLEFEENLKQKNTVIDQIAHLVSNMANNHSKVQNQIKEFEQLREQFYKIGRVPSKSQKEIINRLKAVTKDFNTKKNQFYKAQKKSQQENLRLKKELVVKANALKDSDDFKNVTPEMIKIQNDWKNIGHIPRNQSEKLWQEFKNACNHYFDRINKEKNQVQKEEDKNFKAKMNILEELKKFNPEKDQEKNLKLINELMMRWDATGYVPRHKMKQLSTYQKLIEKCYSKMGLTPEQAEFLSFDQKFDLLTTQEDVNAIQKERMRIREKVNQLKDQTRQLENNLQFFANAKDDNPLVNNVLKEIEQHNEAIQGWNEKSKQLNILVHKLTKAQTEESAVEESDEG
jgi:ribosomal protein S16